MKDFVRGALPVQVGRLGITARIPRIDGYGMAVMLCAGLLFSGCRKKEPIEMLAPPNTPQALQKYWGLPDFALTERSGKTVGLGDLLGKVWVANFIYTTCPGPCPILSSRLSELQKILGSETGVRFVSITTDPEKDTPEVLKAYADRFKAGDRWLFLTGSKDSIYALARDGFKLPIAEAASESAPIVHSTRLILVDKAGAVRGFYDGAGEVSAPSLPGDIRRLLEEK